ncbi:hypothetical protein Zmor_022528 [Zophobas morio]|uniref:C2H2-type domain-containing protein n=1 Tax=Zophobas morio TaxID=2755281 RepID=A0AA38M640_9CUCU|nr:hypothetical protein Zmor_022528 [Zophobas morio]
MSKQTTKQISDHKNKKLRTPSNKKPPFCAQNLKPYTCTTCKYSTHLKVFFKEHSHSKEKQKPPQTLKHYFCDICGLRTHSIVFFLVHKRKCAPKAINLNYRTILMYRCKQCPFQIKRLHKLRQHVEKIHSTCFDASKWDKFNMNIILPKLVRCGLCSHMCVRSSLRHHIADKHPSQSAKAKLYKCDRCQKSFKNKKYFQVHRRSKHTSEGYKCEQCSFKTNYESTLQNHVKVYHSENAKWFQCELCEYKGRTSKLLNDHKTNIHELKTLVRCGLCNFVTNHKVSLKKHIGCKHGRDIERLTKLNARIGS